MARAKRKTTRAGRRAKRPDVVNLLEYEALAKKRVSAATYDFVAGGAGDELTLRWNREAFDAIRLKPRVLRDVSGIDTSVELLGMWLPHPILLAPAAYQKLMHPEGERATARGAGAAGAVLVVSSFATTRLEDVAKAASAPLWFQLYMVPDRAITKDLVQRAEASGYGALCITVDTPVLGTRNREMRSGFRLPKGMTRKNLERLDARLASAVHFGEDEESISALNPKLTWEEIDWACSLTKLPVLLKGILSPEDAKLAGQHGAAGVIVSNHGARNLDTVPATIEALAGVVEAVAGKSAVLLDGGVRRGTDVLKAIALGARAVLIGRPYLWALALEGERGVERAVKILLEELKAAMALCGRPTLASIDRTVLWPEK